MAAANNEFFEALSMLEHERGITAEYLIEKIKAAIIIAVKKNYEVEKGIGPSRCSFFSSVSPSMKSMTM